PGAVRKTPQQGAERRAGPRHGPVISGDPEMGSTARRATRCGVPHQRLSALCSPRFFRGAETDKGNPGALPKPGGGALAFLASPCIIDQQHGHPMPEKTRVSCVGEVMV